MRNTSWLLLLLSLSMLAHGQNCTFSTMTLATTSTKGWSRGLAHPMPLSKNVK